MGIGIRILETESITPDTPRTQNTTAVTIVILTRMCCCHLVNEFQKACTALIIGEI